MPITPPQNSVGGQIWSWMNIDAGPSIGWVRRPLFNDKYLTAANTPYTVQPFDWRLLINLTVAAPFQIYLPPIATWMRQPYGLFPINVKDVGNTVNDTTGIVTVSTTDGANIDGLTSVQLITTGGSMSFEPRSDLSGWNLLP